MANTSTRTAVVSAPLPYFRVSKEKQLTKNIFRQEIKTVHADEIENVALWCESDLSCLPPGGVGGGGALCGARVPESRRSQGPGRRLKALALFMALFRSCDQQSSC